MSKNPPTTIGKYQIIREIARSNDIVYEAYDNRMNRRVAVKELAMPAGASKQQQEDRLKRFEREARAAGSLVHPNIVTVYEVSSDGDTDYIAMEYLTGNNLRKVIDKTGFMEPKKAVEIILEVCQGLAFAHENGIIHRDIKPDNVQILDDGQVKLTDFGIARLTFEPNITMDGQVFGTPSYMSPEQINGQDIDARSDLFSVGVLLYEMVAGEKPFQGDSVVSITYAIMNKKPDQPKQANFTLWQIMDKAMEKTPELRFHSADEMIGALNQVLKTFEPGNVVLDPLQTQQPIQPGPVVNAPPPVYNPGMPQQPQAPPQGVTPYGTPAPPPPQGVYQVPYQPQQQQQQYTPYNPQAQGQVPVYYPPPPRAPIIKPEHKQAVAKFFIAVLLIGATIGFVILVINALANSNAGISGSENSSSPLSFDPVGERSLPTNNSRSPTESARGADVKSNKVAPSVSSVNDYIENQPTSRSDDSPTPPANATSSSQTQQAVSLVTRGTTSSSTRLDAWQRADSLFRDAITSTNSTATQASIRRQAVSSYSTAASNLEMSGDRSAARSALRHAKGFASNDPDTLQRLDLWIDKLGG